MKFVEYINVNKLKSLLLAWDTIVELDILSPTEHKEQYYKNLYILLERYSKQVQWVNDRGIGKVKVDYLPAKSTDDDIPRREYPVNSLSIICFPKEIRNILIQNNEGTPLSIDIDIKNCHPTIYYQFLIQDGYPSEKLLHLQDYIYNRQKWIHNNGSQIKQSIISVINGATLIQTDTIHTELDELCREIWNSHNWLKEKYNLQDLQTLKKFVFNKNTEIERKIIDNAIDFTKTYTNNNSIITTYTYDGFLMMKDKTHFNTQKKIDKFLKQLNSKMSLENYVCEFVEKPLETNNKLNYIIQNVKKPNKEIYDLTLKDGQFIGDIIIKNIFTDFLEDIIVIQAGFGKGKSHKTMNDILTLRNQGHKITTISILNRISLIDNIKHDYPFVYSYREDTTTSNKQIIDGVDKSVVICAESLYRLSEETKKQCKYLILDELMSLLPQMICSETHGKNMRTNQEIFLGLIRNAEKIVIMDANISQSTIDFIKMIRTTKNHTPTIKKWLVQPNKNKNIYFLNDSILSKMEHSINENKKFLICCTRTIKYGMGVLSRLQEIAPNKKMIYINSETKQQYAELIKNPSLWINYDVIMISPCISTGVSCILKYHFDEIFCLFTTGTTNPLDASQQIGRVRYPTTNNIYIHILYTPNQNYKFGWMSQKEVLKMMYNNTHDLYKRDYNFVDTEFNYDNFSTKILDTPRTQLFLFNYEEQSFLYSTYYIRLRDALENSYLCNFMDDTDLNLPEGRTYINDKGIEYNNEDLLGMEAAQLSNEYMNTRVQNIFKAQNLTTEEYELLEKQNQKNENLTDTQKLSIEKYWISVKSKMSLNDIDDFYNSNIRNREPRQLYNLFNNRIQKTLNPLNRFIYNLKGANEHDSNKVYLERLFNPVSLNIQDYNDDEKINTKWLKDSTNGVFNRFYWVEKILQIFGSKYLFQSLKISKDEFDEKYEKFKEWTKLLAIPLNKGVFNHHRVKDLFGVSKQEIENSKKIGIINTIVNKIGLDFKVDTRRKQYKGVKTTESYYDLQLIYPILLNKYLEPEPIIEPTENKQILNLTHDTLPILITGGYPKMDDDWIELYKNSVFYKLPKVKTKLIEEKDENEDENE